MLQISWLLAFSFRLAKQVIHQKNYSANAPFLLFNYRWESELRQKQWRLRIYGQKLWWTLFLEDIVQISKKQNQLIFFGVFGPKKLISIPTAKPKIWLTEEDTEFRFKNYDDYCLDQVHLSIGFKPIKKDNYIRIPYWMYQYINPGFNRRIEQQGFTGLTTLRSPGEFCNRIKTVARWAGREHYASIVCRHDSHGSGAGMRGKLVKAIEPLGRIEKAGIWQNNTDILKTRYNDDMRSFLGDCRYNICIENSNSTGYVTEKVFQSLLAGSLPIYWGGANYMEPEVLTGHGIILLGDEGIEGVVKEMRRLNTDPEYREEWMSKPILTPWAEEWIEEQMHKLKLEFERILNL